MTIREALIEKLVEHGLWPEEASVVMEKVEAETENMKGRWNDRPSDYPVAMFAVLWLTTKLKAVEHLKQTKPKHFALMVLEDNWKEPRHEKALSPLPPR